MLVNLTILPDGTALNADDLGFLLSETGLQPVVSGSSPFLRNLTPGYGTYLGQYLPAPGEGDSDAHPFASALDAATHNFGTGLVVAQPDYAIGTDQGTGDPIVHTVVDYTPRMISQVIVSQAALEATGVANGTDDFTGMPFVGSLATTPGDPSFTGLFVLFGQFVDHGLDLVGKGGNIDPDSGTSAKVIIPLAESDPLYGFTPGHQMTISRATVASVDGEGTPEYENLTSPRIDQNQTYGSDPAVTLLLREWVEDPNDPGTFIPGMRLFDGDSLGTEWTRWDGVATTQTMPTVTELRIAVHETLNPALGRTDLTYADFFNYQGTGQALLLDTMPVANGIDTTSDLNIFGDGPNILKDVDLGSLLILMPEDPGDPDSRIFILGVQPEADPVLVEEAMLQAIGAHYVAGDGRVNENIGLSSLHHVFHEEHNYQVDFLTGTILTAYAEGRYTSDQLHAWQTPVAGPGGMPLVDSSGNYVDAGGAISWDQDRIFEAAKLVVTMEDQHVTIEQYARLVTPDLPVFTGYDAGKDVSISLEYGQAAFRFGHSQLREAIDTIDPDGGITGQVVQLALTAAFLSPDKFADFGPGAITLGMSHQLGNEIDEFVTPALQQMLLGMPLDLAAINIARGRDVGLPTLNEARAQIHAALQELDYPLSGDLEPYASWTDFGDNLLHPESLVNFIAAYSFDGDLDAAAAAMDDAGFMNGGDQGFQKIDLWIGGLAERHVEGGLLGATFNAIFVDQIERLMHGDMAFYLAQLDDELPGANNLADLLSELQLKDIIARTTGVEHLAGNVFLHADSYLDLGRVPDGAELAARGTGDDAHKYGDLTASAGHGVYSGNGPSNADNGSTVLIEGASYIRDARPNGETGPDGATPVSGFDAHEVIAGTGFDDLLHGGGGFDTLYGGDGNDRLFGDDGSDFIYGEGGNDVIDGGAGDDHLDGGDGNDMIQGGPGADIVIGGNGNDQLFGGMDDDEILGGTGSDMIDGGAGADLLHGDDGADLIRGAGGDDEIDGGTGHDIARYAGARADYTISTASDGVTTITDNRQGSPDGVDRLTRIETLEFSDQAYQLIANSPPVLTGPQTAMIEGGSAEAYLVLTADLVRGFTDADGDPLSASGVTANAGELVDNEDGTWTLTPPPHFEGTITLSYTVSDGFGGSVAATLLLPVSSVNHDPVLDPPQAPLFVQLSSSMELVMSASDQDGDTMQYMMSDPDHGTMTTGAGGQFIYTPDPGYLGTDSVMVSVSDGNGGFAQQALAITVLAPPAQGWYLVTRDGFSGEIGGSGQVFGTTGFQDIAILDQPGSIFVDPSFNRGGDIIRLDGDAGDWQVIQAGSTATFSDGDTFVQIPVGMVGAAIIFDDGVRTLRFDALDGSMKIGEQSFGDELVAVTAPADGALLPAGGDPAAFASLYLGSGAVVSAGGNLEIFGTADAEQVSLTGGDVMLDASFNKGGDVLILDEAASGFTAVQAGSAVQLEGIDIDVLIPAGDVGMTLSFPGGDDRTLLFDTGNSTFWIGSQQIGMTPAALTDFA